MSLNPFEEFPLFAHAKAQSRNPQSGVDQPRHWSVTELTSQIRSTLEPAFSSVWVKGEVSNFRPAASGHVYFSLKDEGACISAAVFRWGARKKTFELKDGIQVLCQGKLSVYPPRGTYQLIIEQMEPLGAGALQVAFEQLKKKLALEGLFQSERKRPLPRFPLRIAVITSPSGAVIQDMLNILKRRAPQIGVRIIPALVQGSEAPQQLIRALEIVNRHKLADLIVLARGGGSIEDLWCFNDEALARKIVQSELPVISAVGHEIDFTISDFVADLRAPTPSAAAELLSGSWVEASSQFRERALRFTNGMRRDLLTRKTVLAHIAARLISPRDRLREQSQRIDDLTQRLERSAQVFVDRKRTLLEKSMGRLDALSPLRVLERGYTLVRESGSEGKVVKSVNQVNEGQILEVTFYDGKRAVQAL